MGNMDEILLDVETLDSNGKEYFDIIRDAAENKIDKNIPNSTMEHAEIGIHYLLANAENDTTVKIVSDEFFTDFWVKMKEALKNFLEKHGKLEVILMNKKNTLLDELKTKYTDRVKIFLMKDKVKSKVKSIPHFIVVEPVGYRVELSDDLMKEKIVKGVLNYGSVSGSDMFKKLFNNLKSLTEEIKNI